MGYFSYYNGQNLPARQDHSYTPPQTKLLERLEELQDRLEVLNGKGKIVSDGVRLSEDDLRYVLPRHFTSAYDVAQAIDLAICDLKERYGIMVYQAPEEEIPAVDEVTDMQITFLDLRLNTVPAA